MVRHVIMWKFKNKDDIERTRKQLESMLGKVPSARSIEIGLDFRKGESSYDIVLITAHKDRAELDAYQADPFHNQVKTVLRTFKSEVSVVDYEV